MLPLRNGAWKWLAVAGMMMAILSGCEPVKMGVLNPKGPVAQKQYDLIIWSVVLMSVILIVVFVLFVVILVRFRASKLSKDYEPPDVEGNTFLEIVWTAIPVLIVVALAVPTVTSTFDLEKSPSPNKKPITIEATSAQWKWIFKYPEQGIETVNYLKIPANVPVRFKLSSHDAMNSFWIPELGGQEYTMADMPMFLWLEADKPGKFIGRGNNFSGRDFAKMEFTVEAKKQSDFDSWVDHVKKTAPKQSEKEYKALLKPGTVDLKTYSSYPKSAEVKEPNHGGMEHGGMDMDHSKMKHEDMEGMEDMPGMDHDKN
ncbi:cytochrome aa3-600 menaquinol oxidase subunit 2 [Marininema halotolerans]|uniref:Quinol oxidase subunit 2 n=1 Tax=Marininema halotolerans TaxID=1155944 RepID=A0A1I6SLA6_9BACL|nr:cytochrome aa3 quinol oxidase subunit II [Marininema halotolerans]SFS77742.1 cytochrome aa3-600 menaquinol oxidase subunit 2 [Marininema halotolerans]